MYIKFLHASLIANYEAVVVELMFEDKPDSITLEWEHSINKPGSVEANQDYKIKCVTKNSHPPAVHRFFKGGVELSASNINYTFNNYTDTGKQYLR